MEQILIFILSFLVFFLVGLRLGKKASSKAPRREPKPGEWWRFVREQQGPWPMDEFPPVQIIDVKEGWVLYSMDPNSRLVGRNRLTVRSFVRMYIPATDYGALK